MRTLRRFFPPLLLLCLFAALLRLAPSPRDGGTPVSLPPKAPERRVLLVPLDSRPPCTRFVADAARIVNVEVLLPPADILDDYLRAGDTAALADWTRANLAGCDAAILSVDQLLHGGLLAARRAEKTPADAEALLSLLTELRDAHPQVPLYAFSILPRMTPPDGLCDWHEQKRLMSWSRLMDRVARTPHPEAADLEALEVLRSSVPSEIVARYESLFAEAATFNTRLIGLARRGVLARLVIGQDDSEPYGMPNIVLRRLRDEVAAHPAESGRVLLTHGADEIALSLLAALEARRAGFAPRVALAFNDASTPGRVLPYMAISVEETAREKLRLTGGSVVPEAEAADFTLYLSANDTDMDDTRRKAASELAAMLATDRHVALVDLAEHFRADETLLPLLLACGAPLQTLEAYAGWNTASNAVGTAVAQATLLETAKRRARTRDDTLRLFDAHIAFLDSRILEDYFYLKDIIDHLNFSLEKLGAQNGRGLEYNYNYPVGSLLLESALRDRTARFTRSEAFSAPFTVKTPDGPLRLRAAGLEAEARFPWPRTFEIDLRVRLKLEELP